MPIVNRRQALQHFGIASVTPLLPSETPTARKVVAVKPGENRYEYDVAGLRTSAACKLTSQDTSGASSIFELANQPKMGPPRHVHHREDEWYYVLSGSFLFQVGEAKIHLVDGSSHLGPARYPSRLG